MIPIDVFYDISNYQYPYEVRNLKLINHDFYDKMKQIITNHKKVHEIYYILENNLEIYLKMLIKHIRWMYEKYNYDKNIPIFQEMKFPPDSDFIFENLDYYLGEDTYNIRLSIFNYIENSNFTLDDFILSFINCKSVIIENTSGFNDDERCISKDLKYIDKPELYQKVYHEFDGNLSLQDLATAYIQSKSSKFDFWYELFCGVNLEIDNNKLIIELNIDHGS